MALNPPGSLLIVVPKDLHPSWNGAPEDIEVDVKIGVNRISLQIQPTGENTIPRFMGGCARADLRSQ
jgi:hypothetical protein